MSEYSRRVPIVALRGMAVLPGMLIHFDVNRQISIEAIENAMENDQLILLLTQKDEEIENPVMEDLHQIGTIALVKQIVKLPGNIIRVLVTGTERAKLENLIEEKPFLYGDIELLKEKNMLTLKETEKKAMIRGLKDILGAYLNETPKIAKKK